MIVGRAHAIATVKSLQYRRAPEFTDPPENTTLIGFVLYFADHPSALPMLRGSAPPLFLQ